MEPGDEMTGEKICPFMSTVIAREREANAIMVACKEEKCMAWREISHGVYDCVLIRCRLIP